MSTGSVQASAPPEAEVYYGTAEEAFNGEVPLASAVPLSGEDHPDEPHGATPLVESQHGFATATTTAEANFVSGLKLEPKRIRCPFCHEEAVTNTHQVVDLFTIICVGIIFLVFWPCCWIPLVLPGCKRTEHFCSNCHRQVRKIMMKNIIPLIANTRLTEALKTLETTLGWSCPSVCRRVWLLRMLSHILADCLFCLAPMNRYL